MTQALITSINSVWGVIRNPHSDNVYRHILAFETPELKDQFINQYLFNDINYDYKAKITEKPKISFVRTTATFGNFRIRISDYPELSEDEILNSDLAIIKHNEQFLFYVVSFVRIGAGIYEAQCELDLFFTYDVKTIFNNNLTAIMRSHMTRQIPDIKYIEQSFNEPELDDIDTNKLLPTSSKLFIETDFTQNIQINSNIIKTMTSAQQIEFINNQLNKPWLVTYWNKLPLDDGQGTGINAVKFQVNNIKEPFYILTHPAVALKWVGTNVISEPGHLFDFIGSDTSELVQGATTFTPLTPCNQNKFATNFKFQVADDESTIEIYQSDGDGGVDSTPLQNGFAAAPYFIKGVAQNIFFCKFTYSYKTPQINNFPSLNIPNIDTDITSKVDLTQELKSYYWPYQQIRIASSTGQSFNWGAQYANGDTGDIVAEFSYNPEQWAQHLILLNYGLEAMPPNANIGYNDTAVYSLFTDINAWNQFILTNKSQQNTQFALEGLAAIGGVAALSGASGAAKLLGGGSILGAGTQLLQQFGMRQDIKRTPNEIKANSGSLNFDIVNKDIRWFMYNEQLHPSDLKYVQQTFYKYGYNLNSILKNINDLITSRYYFNYVQASAVYENITLRLAPELKQVIDSTFATGVTIWHVRDLKSFKGVKNYDYNNIEMELIDG